MKPIIVDMNEMSDSREVYDSKPNPVLIYTIYIVFFILFCTLLWAYFFRIDVVIKSDGLFKNNESVYEISSGVTGKVTEIFTENGKFVNEGDTLYAIDIDSLSETISNYVKDLEMVEHRLDILKAYEESLTKGVEVLEKHKDNPYYDEFLNRRELLYANIAANEEDTHNQITVYEGNINNTSETIQKYKSKIANFEIVKQCIVSRNNTFTSSDSYCYSLINSYIASYNYIALGYDNKIKEYQSQIEDYNKQIQKIEVTNTKSAETVDSTELSSSDVDTLKKQIVTINQTIEALKTEKIQALNETELQQISNIEQQIENLKNTLFSLESTLTSEELQLETIKKSGNTKNEDISILTEKGTIFSEILNYQEKKQEDENYLKSYDIQNDNCNIKAASSGYFYEGEELQIGSYVQEGASLGKIYPDKESQYYAEIYIKNSDIAKIKEGQQVKFEISAYPSREYGYFTGIVESIAKDITIDSNTGYAYYLVNVSCNDITLKNKKNEKAELKNGMACEAKIIVEEKRVLNYLLEKIHLLD